MAERIEQLDRVSGSKRKTQWVVAEDTLQAHAAEKITAPTKEASTLDSLESLESKESPSTKVKKQESSPGFWATVWSKVCSLFGYSAAPTTSAGDGSSNKPGGDGVQSVSGSPVLKAPSLIDMERFTRMLKETRDSLNQIKETNNEGDEEFNRSEQQLLEYLKTQRSLYEEGADLVKTKYLQHQGAQREVRKKLGDAKTEAAEAAANDRTWGWWKTGTTFALIAVAVAFVAISANATAGLSLGAAGAAFTAAIQIAGPLASAAHAITSIMKGAMTSQMRDKQGSVTSLTHQSNRFTEFKIPEDMMQLNQNFEQSLKIVTEHLRGLQEKRSNTIRSLVSGMSGRP